MITVIDKIIINRQFNNLRNHKPQTKQRKSSNVDVENDLKKMRILSHVNTLRGHKLNKVNILQTFTMIS